MLADVLLVIASSLMQLLMVLLPSVMVCKSIDALKELHHG